MTKNNSGYGARQGLVFHTDLTRTRLEFADQAVEDQRAGLEDLLLGVALPQEILC